VSRPDALLREASVALAGRSDSPAADARILLAHVVGRSPATLLLADRIGPVEADRFRALVERRAAGTPVQHLTGEAHFRRITLKVGPGVFVPRPETETMVGWAIEALAGVPQPVIVELCAGSGAISAALADELPASRLSCIELDPVAAEYARANLAGTGTHVTVGDMATAFPELDGAVDLVIANPPYIPAGHAAILPGDVLGHDPALALFGGADGLDAVRVVARTAGRLLRGGGRVACEHDDVHGIGAPEVFVTEGFLDVADHRDLAGRPRFVTGRRR
jgi:release factor glutamine methyltransferase